MLIDCLKLLVYASIVVLSAVELAGGAELPTELTDCRALTSATQRLDCYDQFIDAQGISPNQAPIRQTTDKAAPVEPAAATATEESEPKLSQEDIFGKGETERRKSVQDATDTKEIDQIEATVAEVRKSASGQAVITLDNGQVWLQTESSRARISVNDKVTIRRRSFGSYTLYNKKTAIRVKRIS
jgi:hypothetical protein